MRQKLYRTKQPITTLNLTIPAGSFAKQKFRSEGAEDEAYYEFVGLFSGLSKILKDDEVIFDSYHHF